jgi:hypothetical protein
MPRDLELEGEAFNERVAIAMADGLCEECAQKIADEQLWKTIRKAESSLRAPGDVSVERGARASPKEAG